MVGWNPRDSTIKKEVIELVNNEFWWHEPFSRNTKTNHAIEFLAQEVINLRSREKNNKEKTTFLLKLLDELGKHPEKLSSHAALGNEKETFEAFKDYVRFVISIANRRLDIFEEKTLDRVWTDCKHGRWLSPCPICTEENKMLERITTPKG